MKFDWRNSTLKKWLKISAIVHIVGLVILIFGLPHFVDKSTPVVPRIIPVDIVNISEVTNTRVADKPDPAPTPAPQAVEQQKPTPVQEQKPEDKPKPSEAKEQPKPVEDAEALPDKKKPPEKEKDKKEEKKKEEKKEEKPKDLLASVLKNVEKLKKEVKQQPVVKDAPKAETPIQVDEAPALAQQLSITEMDALRRQIQQCWNVPVGARGIENMNVEIYIEVKEDRTVSRVEVVDTLRMATDSFFRTVAESARRALYNPRCSPLMLPPDKFSDWNKIRMNFNPAEMF